MFLSMLTPQLAVLDLELHGPVHRHTQQLVAMVTQNHASLTLEPNKQENLTTRNTLQSAIDIRDTFLWHMCSYK